MKFIPADYEAPDEFEVFSDGKYKAVSFEWFTLNDDKPIMVAQSDGKMVGRLRFILEEGKDGPPMSVELGEMALLAKAFGIDNLPIPPLPHEAGKVSSYMEFIQKVPEGKSVEIEVKNGWVNVVKGMSVPPGYYYFTLVDGFPKDDNGDLIAKEGTWGPIFHLTFQVEAGEGGSSTPYRGCRFTEFYIGFDLLDKDGEIDWKRTEKGGYTASAIRLSTLMRSTVPSLFETSFNSAAEVLKQWFKLGKANNVVLKSDLGKDQKGRIKLNWGGLQVASAFTPLEVKNEDVSNGDNLSTTDYLESLKLAMNQISDNGLAVSDDYKLNPEGVKLAKKYFTPLKKAGIITHGNFKDLEFNEVVAIMDALIEDYDIAEIKESLLHTGLGFTDPTEKEEEWADTPF